MTASYPLVSKGLDNHSSAFRVSMARHLRSMMQEVMGQIVADIAEDAAAEY